MKILKGISPSYFLRSQQPGEFAFKITNSTPTSPHPLTLVSNQKMAAFCPSFISDIFVELGLHFHFSVYYDFLLVLNVD